jgi:hypothetical protein
MHHFALLLIIFSHTSFAFSPFPYQKRTLKLPKHPSGWMCTAHVTVATFANYHSSDLTDRFLTSNRERIIPTVSTMLNRSISIAPVNSFFESCTVSILIDSIINGSSYITGKHGIAVYVQANEYVFRGWRHSVIIVIHFTCFPTYHAASKHLPHRLFYHSTKCGPQNTFPNHVYVPGPVQYLLTIDDPTHNIHDRKLPLELTSLIPRPVYSWDGHNPNMNPKYYLAALWKLPLVPFLVGEVSIYHFQHYLNFTTVKYTLDNFENFGAVFSMKNELNLKNSIFVHATGSSSDRIMYCDRNLDSSRFRPINLLSPLSIATWVMLVSVLIVCATVSSFAIFHFGSISNNWTAVALIKMVLNSLVDHVVLLLDQDLGKHSTTKIFIGLMVICLGNDYKNHLTIKLVYPRAQEAIRNVTELLDLNFNIFYIYKTGIALEGVDKSILLKSLTLYWAIDEAKRKKYVREVDHWFMLIDKAGYVLNSKITNLTEKNAYLVSASYHRQVHILNIFNTVSYPISCHFVKQPFAPKFVNLYFFNPKAEEFKWLTAKFLDHGLFQFWTGWETQQLRLFHRRMEKHYKMSKKSSSTEVLDIQNFIGQVHLFVFYILISILTGICVVVFVFECAIQDARQLSLFVFAKLMHIIFQLLYTIVRSLCLMSRLLSQLYEKS